MVGVKFGKRTDLLYFYLDLKGAGTDDGERSLLAYMQTGMHVGLQFKTFVFVNG